MAIRPEPGALCFGQSSRSQMCAQLPRSEKKNLYTAGRSRIALKQTLRHLGRACLAPVQWGQSRSAKLRCSALLWPPDKIHVIFRRPAPLNGYETDFCEAGIQDPWRSCQCKKLLAASRVEPSALLRNSCLPEVWVSDDIDNGLRTPTDHVKELG